MRTGLIAGVLTGAAVLASAMSIRADIVAMQNADRYNGKVLSLNETELVLQNDVLGKIVLPRAKVAGITLSMAAPDFRSGATSTNARPATLPPAGRALSQAQTNAFAAQLAAHPEIVDKVQKEILAGADPAASAKFNELVSGLVGGTLSIDDLRREARATADQVRAMRKDLGDDAGFALDGYLAILDQFLNEGAPGPTATNAQAHARQAAKISARDTTPTYPTSTIPTTAQAPEPDNALAHLPGWVGGCRR